LGQLCNQTSLLKLLSEDSGKANNFNSRNSSNSQDLSVEILNKEEFKTRREPAVAKASIVNILVRISINKTFSSNLLAKCIKQQILYHRVHLALD
jgi:hypothetical protein